MNKKLLTFLFVFIAFCLFFAEEYFRLNSNVVLKILTPTMFQIDLNGNRKPDDNETICLPEVTSFTSNIKADVTELAFKNKLPGKDLIALGYLAEDFASKTLLDEEVKVNFTGENTSQCRLANINVNGKDYRELLTQNGFAIKNNIPQNQEAFSQQLEKAKGLDIVILNHRNNKYHSPDCKYAKAARDTVTLLRRQLPYNAMPCKVCLGENTGSDDDTILKPVPTISGAGDIQIYLTDFTNRLKPDTSCISNICQTIVKNIDETSETIDMAIYGWESVPAVENSLSKAKERGVTIRLVTDTKIPQDKHYPDSEKITALADEYRTDFNPESKLLTNYLMHNKFMIFDGKKVLTGSMNFSRTGLSGFNANSIVIINSVHIAELYKKEFEEMLSGKFHTNKQPSEYNKNIQLGTSIVSVYFSPQDKAISSEIVPLINKAEKYIYIPTFVLTHQGMADALINAKKRGVDVKIIIDGTSSTQLHTKHHTLRTAGVPVKVENYAGKMHMKTMIIDDKYTILGSMNFSNSGENRNDENMLLIEDKNFAEFYKDYFNYIWVKIPDKYLKTDIRAESPDSIGSCSDGVDNDHDGKIDNLDEGCKL